MFGSTRIGAAPDLVTVAKGLTSAYAPMGAVLVSDRVAAPLYEDDRVLMHGHTFGGHPLSAAIALQNIEIFARDGVVANVRALEPHLAARLNGLRELAVVGDVRGMGFLWSVELVKDDQQSPFPADEAGNLVRSVLPRLLTESGLIAKPDNRGATVVTIAPPLISSREELDELVDGLSAALSQL
jgi:adenosylmethionine-8-amino-7-oxononanoate aminotransferase